MNSLESGSTSRGNPRSLGRQRECQNVIPPLMHSCGAILGLLDAVGKSLRVQLARLVHVAARTVGLPFGKNEGIIGLREYKASPRAAGLDSALQHHPRCTDILEYPVKGLISR